MKKQSFITILLTVLISMVGAKAFAYDIAVENADGVTICYNYINDGKELEVAYAQYYKGSIVIPEEVTYLNRTRKVTRIQNKAFYDCRSLTSITIPNSVTSIGGRAFELCISLTSVNIPNSITSIGEATFAGCWALTSVTIPSSVTSIGELAFYDCRSLTSITIPNSVTSIGKSAFQRCSGLTSITIPNSVTSIEAKAFEDCSSTTSVVSLIKEPFAIYKKSSGARTFSLDIFNNATLYVPIGTIDKYKSTEGWKDFLFIEEGTGPSGGGDNPTPTLHKCAKPTVSYQNGKLTFNCDTDGATCLSTITDTDITSYSSNEVKLSVTYNISVYATKFGYENSDIATATLCWIDVEPKTEGITNSVASVRARAVLIHSNCNQLTISGADEGSSINIYDISGRPAGSATASAETTTINTSLHSGDIGIVKIGDKAVKVLMK